MARITVEDCLEVVPNRFTLCLITAERTKQLMKGSQALLDDDRSNKEIVTALREIAAQMIEADMTGYDENENVRVQLGSRDLPPEAGSVVLPPEA